MRLSDPGLAFAPASAVALALALVLAGCAIPLDDQSVPLVTPDPPTPVSPGCRLFHGGVSAGAITALGGAGHSLETAGGEYLWLFDSASTISGSIDSPGALVPAGKTGDCFASSAFVGDPPSSLLDATVLGEGTFATPLDGARLAGGAVLYYQGYELAEGEPFGVRLLGFGVAKLDESTGRYVAQPPLWTADRPSFGTSVLAEGGELFVYGCRGIPDTFATACFVAQVAEADAGDANAYRYYAGGGTWVPDLELAAPIGGGGPTTSVRYVPSRKRYLMTSVPVLGAAIEVRSGLGPEGPWSRALELAACDLPAGDPGAVCSGGIQHPEIAAGGAEGIAVSSAIVSLSDDAAARTAKDPQTYWPRLVIVPWPDALP